MSAKTDNTCLNLLADTVNTSTNQIKVITDSGVVDELSTTQDLSAGALDFTTSETSDFLVNGIYFEFSSSTTQTITLTYSGVKIFEEEVTPNTSVYIDLDNKKIFASLGKQLTIECTNTGTPSITVDLTIDIEVV